MSGCVGYTGVQSALDVLLGGLGRLAGRDPDHDAAGVAGVALVADGGLAAARRAGTLADLRALIADRPLPAAGTGVGHVGRVTGGGPAADTDAQPHLDAAGRVAVVRDGGVENHAALRAGIAARGHRFESGTDTEVVAHLLAESFSSCGEPGEAMRQVCRSLRGSFALIAVHADDPDAVVAARRGLPLVVGVGAGESFVATDGAAFAGESVGEVLRLDAAGGDEVVVLRRDGDEARCEITDAEGGVVRA